MDTEFSLNRPSARTPPGQDMVAVGAGLIAEAHAEAVLGRIHSRRLGEVVAAVADGVVPDGGGGGGAPDVEADAVIDDAPQREGSVLHAAAVVQRAHADGESLDAPELDLRGIDIAHGDADIGLGGPIR
jgi:hypothetical protein